MAEPFRRVLGTAACQSIHECQGRPNFNQPPVVDESVKTIIEEITLFKSKDESIREFLNKLHNTFKNKHVLKFNTPLCLSAALHSSIVQHEGIKTKVIEYDNQTYSLYFSYIRTQAE